MSEIDLTESLAETSEEAAPEQIETSEEEKPQESGWYWTDDVAGEGDKPEFLLDKYGSISDQAKAYKELEQKFGGFTGAPEAYDFTSFEEKGLTFEEGNKQYDKFMEVAKANNMSQKCMNEILDVYGDEIKSKMPPSRDEIYASLGDSAEDIISKLATFGGNILTEEEMPILNEMLGSADKINVMNKIRKAIRQESIQAPAPNAQASVIGRTAKQIQNEIVQNYQRYQDDEGYRKSLLSELDEVLSS